MSCTTTACNQSSDHTDKAMLSRPLILHSLGFARCVSCKMNSVPFCYGRQKGGRHKSVYVRKKMTKITEFLLFMFEFYLFSSGMTLTRSRSVGRRAHLQAFTFLRALTLKITGHYVDLIVRAVLLCCEPPTASSLSGARVYRGSQPEPTRVMTHPGRAVETPERQLVPCAVACAVVVA